jgi:hypothetical protein
VIESVVRQVGSSHDLVTIVDSPCKRVGTAEGAKVGENSLPQERSMVSALRLPFSDNMAGVVYVLEVEMPSSKVV